MAGIRDLHKLLKVNKDFKKPDEEIDVLKWLIMLGYRWKKNMSCLVCWMNVSGRNM